MNAVVKTTAPARKINTRDASQDNAKLDELAKRFKDKTTELDAVIKRNSDALDKLNQLPDDLKGDLEARAKELADISAQLSQLEQRMVDGIESRSQAEQNTIAACLIRNKDAVDQAALMAVRNGKQSVMFEGLSARNVITTAVLGGANALMATNDLERTALSMPLSIIDMINWIPTDQQVEYFLRESSFDILADIAPENTDKPQSSLTFGTATLVVGTIAHWIKASKQILADMSALAAYIETRMAYGVRLKLEYFVVNGHTPAAGQQKNFSGLLEEGNFEELNALDGETEIDVLNRAKYKAVAAYLPPDTVLLHPEDWGNIERIKGTDGHYIFGTPGASVQPVLWGVPVRFSFAIPKGKYWVGNLALAFDGKLREDVTITVATEDGNNVTKNLVTILAEMRACGAVVLPTACISGDLVFA